MQIGFVPTVNASTFFFTSAKGVVEQRTLGGYQHPATRSTEALDRMVRGTEAMVNRHAYFADFDHSAWSFAAAGLPHPEAEKLGKFIQRSRQDPRLSVVMPFAEINFILSRSSVLDLPVCVLDRGVNLYLHDVEQNGVYFFPTANVASYIDENQMDREFPRQVDEQKSDERKMEHVRGIVISGKVTENAIQAARVLFHEMTHFVDHEIIDLWMKANASLPPGQRDELYKKFTRDENGKRVIDIGFVFFYFEFRSAIAAFHIDQLMGEEKYNALLDCFKHIMRNLEHPSVAREAQKIGVTLSAITNDPMLVLRKAQWMQDIVGQTIRKAGFLR